MYMQDLDHLKVDLKDIPKILSKSNCTEWAYIIHDKDKKDNDNSKIRPHIHLVLKYTNPQILSHVARRLLKEYKPQYLQVWKGRINNAYSYLIHATEDAENKFQYDPSEVVASFDYVSRMKEIAQKVKKHTSNSKMVNTFIELYADRKISFDDLENKIGIVQLAKHKTVIDQIDELNAMKKHKEWLKQFKNKRSETIWLWGSAGVGKTRYARFLLKNDDDVAILGSSRDYFQEYHGETKVILNDLRMNDFKYQDLLRITDPYEHDKMAPRRYHDIPLNIEMLIITTPYSPSEFYKETKIDNREIDTFDQLKRRVHSIHVTKKFMKEVMPDEFN